MPIILVVMFFTAVMLCLNLLALAAFFRMRRIGRRVAPLQLLLVSSDILALAIGGLWWMPVTELTAVDRTDFLCHHWVLAAVLRFGIVAVASAVLASQMFILAASIERLRALRDPVEYMASDANRVVRHIVAVVSVVSLGLGFVAQFDYAEYQMPQLRLRALSLGSARLDRYALSTAAYGATGASPSLSATSSPSATTTSATGLHSFLMASRYSGLPHQVLAGRDSRFSTTLWPFC